MNRELIIEKYGQGNAVVVLDNKKIIDLFVDPPLCSKFYPPNTFVEAKIQRRISRIGGYFVKLPSGNQGFLRSKAYYKEGEAVVIALILAEFIAIDFSGMDFNVFKGYFFVS